MKEFIDMKRLAMALVVAGVVFAVVLGIGPTFDGDPTSPAVAGQPMPTAQAISLFQARVTANSDDAVSSTILGELFSRQARETGDVSRLQRAEAALDQALDSLPGYPRAQAALAKVYVSQHRFFEALDLAEKANEADPSSGAVITIGDAQLVLGEYSQARRTFVTARDTLATPVIDARLAHIDEIYGKLERARTTMDRATDAFLANGGSGEAAAWFEMRRGDLAFAAGEYEAAVTAYEDSLESLPDYPGSLAGLGRSRAALGDLAGAIAGYEHAVAVQPLPASLLALGELYDLDGQPDRAAEAYGSLEVISELSDGLFDLSLAFYEANHGSPSVAVDLASGLVDNRPDLFSYDALAWAAFKADDLETARGAADMAVETGPANAAIWYHSGAIWASMGNKDRALADLEKASDLSPRFDPLAAADMRRLLTELRG